MAGREAELGKKPPTRHVFSGVCARHPGLVGILFSHSRPLARKTGRADIW